MYLSTTIVIILATAILSYLAWTKRDLMNRWILNPYMVVERKQYYRMITSGFLHLDWMHLLFNMFSLYFFGPTIEYFMRYFWGVSFIPYILFYIVAIVVASIPSVLKHKHNHYYNSLGASGAVSAVIFASIILNPLSKIYIFLIPIGIPAFIYGVLFLGYEYYLGKRGNTGVNHDAHFYGAIFGALFVILAFPGALTNFFEELSKWSMF